MKNAAALVCLFLAGYAKAMLYIIICYPQKLLLYPQLLQYKRYIIAPIIEGPTNSAAAALLLFHVIMITAAQDLLRQYFQDVKADQYEKAFAAMKVIILPSTGYLTGMLLI